MSVNFHAFQNRGYLLAEHEADAELWYERFAGFDPERIARILDLKRDEDHLYLPYFDNLYRLVLATGRFQRKLREDEPVQKGTEDTSWTEEIYFNEGMALYHVLQYTVDEPRNAGVWVPGSALDGVVARNPAVHDPLLEPFAAHFSGRLGVFVNACEAFGGTPIKKGDAGFEFRAFSFLPMQIAFWDRDEDFEAQVQVFFDQYVRDYVHFETTGCLISDLFEKLCALDA